ncbi:MAG: hypothetical protein JXN60_05955 [Lentisphaerae bacterium]|nr:hypothetical protein [Lentisphaerota bacterium]
MNQLLLGASVPFFIGVVVYLSRRGRATLRFLFVLPISMGLGMIWAIAPDIPRIVGFDELYHRLYRDPRCDLFLWHYSIDQCESDSMVYTVLFIGMLFILSVVAVRELWFTENY